jgi:NTE family protein
MNPTCRLAGAALLLCLAGCTTFAYQNKPLDGAEARPGRASVNIAEDRGDDGVLTILALSGGGSRAAYFSASVMLRLQEVFADGAGPHLDILSRVDAISAVSGGALPAAYYCISRDTGSKEPVASNREWNAPVVRDLMSRNYLGKWVANWFWPDNILLYWFTAYDRSDVMAQTFADNLFDVSPTGRDLRMQDLNPKRPYLILNATNGTEEAGVGEVPFGSVFSFTREDFRDKVKSDIESYLLSHAVMASAAFPTVFNYVTLRDYKSREDRKRYFHVFDGGNADNLGLTSVKRAIFETELNGKASFKKIVVILVDSFVSSPGVDRDAADARGAFDYVVNLNVVGAVDSLLESNRGRLLDEFRTGNFEVGRGTRDCQKGNLPSTLCEMDAQRLRSMVGEIGKKLVFKHVNLTDSKLKHKLDKIKTNFKFTEDGDGVPNTRWIDEAAQELISQDDACLVHIRNILLNDPAALASGGSGACR